MGGGWDLTSLRQKLHNCHKVKIGALPTWSRTTRGRRGDRLYRAGCMAQITNNHVLQICPRAHKARIDRHDAVLSYLGRNLRRQGFEVQEEPHYRTQEGLRKPDIVATMGTLGLVIDAQIVGEQSDLERARTAKIRKYKSRKTNLTSNGPYSVKPEQPTSFTYRSSSPGGVSGEKHPHQILCHWAPLPREISLSSLPGCSSVVSSPTATSIVQPRSRSEDDIAQRRPPSHPLGATCRSQAQTTSPCTCNLNCKYL